MKLNFTATVSSNKIIFDTPEAFRRYCSAMQGRRVSVTIESAKRCEDRSMNQNRYYWGVIVSIAKDAISEEYGEAIDIESVHELLKERCNYKELVKDDKVLKITKSTSNLSTIEFEEYLDRCRKFIFNWFGVDVPLPNEHFDVSEGL